MVLALRVANKVPIVRSVVNARNSLTGAHVFNSTPARYSRGTQTMSVPSTTAYDSYVTGNATAAHVAPVTAAPNVATPSTTTTTTTTTTKVNGGERLTLANMNPKVVEMRYAVRGLLPQVAEKIASEIANDPESKHAFDEVLFCNIGNPQAVGQAPLTFYREVLGLVDAPSFLNRPDAEEVFGKGVVERARDIVRMIGTTGAYTGAKGVLGIRQNVAQFLLERDGHPAEVDDMYLIGGASAGIRLIMNAVLSGEKDGVLVPTPQYPIYSALITLAGSHQLDYHLDESKGWSFDAEALRETIYDARKMGIDPRIMVVINPGNPTGNVLSFDDLASIARICYEEGLVVFSDEVYQPNIYNNPASTADGGHAPVSFVSMKKVVRDLDIDVQLVSFHSTSKGFIGECGRRGGFMELCGFDSEVKEQIMKLASSSLCPNTNGQVMTDLMVRPPTPGTTESDQFIAERDAIFNGLQRKSIALGKALNAVEGMSCQPLQGAMYAFPKIGMSPKAVASAYAQGQAPDTYYALSLLHRTGICAVPGSGFGQEDGTYHLRLTFLPEENKLVLAAESIKEHHVWFTQQHIE